MKKRNVSAVMAKALTETVMNVKGVWGMDTTTLRTWLVLMVKTLTMNNFIPYENTIVLPRGMVINESRIELTGAVVFENCWFEDNNSSNFSEIMPDERHERGCVRRYGAIPYLWIDHKDCDCHRGGKQ